MSLFNSTTNNANSTAPLIDHVSDGMTIAVNSIGFIIFFGATLFMMIMFIMNYKKMVFNKKLLYWMVLLIFSIENLFQIFGIGNSLAFLLDSIDEVKVLFISLENIAYFSSIVMCANCQAVITKILFGFYFNKSHEWMRLSKRNHRLRGFVKVSSISLVVILNLGMVIATPLVITSNILFHFGIDLQVMSADDSTTFQTSADSIFIAYILMTCSIMLYFTFQNLVIVVLLIRKLVIDQKFPITEQRKKGCRKLLLLTFGQLYMALLNLISLVFGSVGIAFLHPLYPISLVFHKFALLSFCVIVTFSFGPLDHVMLEFKTSNSGTTTNCSTVLQQPSVVETNVEMMVVRDEKSQQAIMNATDIIRKEEFRKEETRNSGTTVCDCKSEVPILADTAEEFTEIPLWEGRTVFPKTNHSSFLDMNRL